MENYIFTYSYLFNSIFLHSIYSMSGAKYFSFLQFFILNIHSYHIRRTKSSCYLQTTGSMDLVNQLNWINNLSRNNHLIRLGYIYFYFWSLIKALLKAKQVFLNQTKFCYKWFLWAENTFYASCENIDNGASWNCFLKSLFT